MLWRCCRSSLASNQHRRSFARTTDLSSSSTLSGAGAPAAAPAPPKSNLDRRGRTALANPSTVGSGMNSSTPSVHHGDGSPGLGQSLALGVQHAQAPFGRPRAYTPGGSSSSCCITTHSHKHWTRKGGHAINTAGTAWRFGSADAEGLLR